MPTSDCPSFSFSRWGDGPLGHPSHGVLANHEVHDAPAGLVHVRHVVAGNLLLLLEDDALGGHVDVVEDVPGVGVVYRHPHLEARRPAQPVRENDGVSDGPLRVLLGRTLDDTLLDDAVVVEVEPDALVGFAGYLVTVGDGALLLQHVAREVDVQPLGMHRIERVLHALEPVARELGHSYVPQDVVPDEQVPSRQQRRGRWPEVRPDQPAQLLHGVARNLDLFLEASVGMDRLLERLLDALARLVHHPAVVHAAQAVLLRYAVGEVDATVGAEAVDESERAGPIAVEDEVLAEDADGPGRPGVELRRDSHRLPVPAHQLAHGRSGTYAREPFVLRR